MTENEEDIELFRSDPGRLIVKYQNTVRMIVKKFIIDGLLTTSDFDDAVQSVNESLLVSIPNMQRNFRGQALVHTYLSLAIRNQCFKVFEKMMRLPRLSPLPDTVTVDPELPPDTVSIPRSVRRLDVVLRMFHSKRPRVILLLKLHYRIPLVVEDITSLFPACAAEDLAYVLQAFSGNYAGMNDYDVYNTIVPLLNTYEHKATESDSVRTWTDLKIEQLIGALNRKPPRAAFDVETLGILLKKYFSPLLPDDGTI